MSQIPDIMIANLSAYNRVFHHTFLRLIHLLMPIIMDNFLMCIKVSKENNELDHKFNAYNNR